jgi:hypothetical protein
MVGIALTLGLWFRNADTQMGLTETNTVVTNCTNIRNNDDDYDDDMMIIIIVIINELNEKFGSCTRKTFDRFTTIDSYAWNITHNTESTAV